MTVFRFDKDKFEQQLKQLETAGKEFDSAQNRFAVGAQAASGAMATTSGSSGASASSSGSGSSGSGSSGGEHWSGIAELDQFHSPLHVSMVAVDQELSRTSRQHKQAIANLRSALLTFTGLDDSLRQSYLSRLSDLDGKFTYRRPEEMAGLVKEYTQVHTMLDKLRAIG